MCFLGCLEWCFFGCLEWCAFGLVLPGFGLVLDDDFAGAVLPPGVAEPLPGEKVVGVGEGEDPEQAATEAEPRMARVVAQPATASLAFSMVTLAGRIF